MVSNTDDVSMESFAAIMDVIYGHAWVGDVGFGKILMARTASGQTECKC